MSGRALQCENCGTIVQDPAADSCPRCGYVIGAPTSKLGDQSWENIDGGWDDLDTAVQDEPRTLAPPGGGGARTLVGMGIPDLQAFPIPGDAPPDTPPEALDSPSTDPEGVVGMTQPMPTLLDDTPPVELAPALVAPEQLSGPIALSLPRGEPSALPTMPMERVPVPSAQRPAPQRRPSPPPDRGRAPGKGLPTLPPEGLPNFGGGLPTLNVPQPAAGFGELSEHDLAHEATQRVAAPPQRVASDVDSHFAAAAFDDVSMRADYELEASSVNRPSEAKTLPPALGPSMLDDALDDTLPPDSGFVQPDPRGPQPIDHGDEAPTQRRPALADVPPLSSGNAAFADNTVDVPTHAPLPRQGTSIGLIALWIVAVAAVVAATLVVVLR
jgi:hypothetical protein